ncbi:MAG: NFYB/HAP3 family transcription factor subunit [Candidatus Pacebacteria bacterium]|nr:NFYB/HAP3 family transcription factor subunit [Candidatus Paceibacterota bacterium]
MQSNKEIGKISQATPFVIAKSLELFLEDLAASTSALAKQHSQTKVTPALLYQHSLAYRKSVIDATPKYHFLKSCVADLGALDEQKKGKRNMYRIVVFDGGREGMANEGLEPARKVDPAKEEPEDEADDVEELSGDP